MKFKANPLLSAQIPSITAIFISSLVAGLIVFSIAVLLQWFIYDDWMHKNGPLRLVGSAFAFTLTFAYVYYWQLGLRERKVEMLRRFERIKRMNDRIRNSLQAIEFVVYAADPHMTDPVKDSVDAIESVLQEVLVETDADSRAHINRPSERSTSGEFFSN